MNLLKRNQVSEIPFNALNKLVVAIINMPLRESAKPNTPPQGPGLLASRLRQYGAKVSLIDLNGYRIHDEKAVNSGLRYGRLLSQEEAEGLISRYFNRDGEPDMIAISGMITTLRWQKRISHFCRMLAPKAFLVSGGGLATEMGRILFSWIPDLDAIAHGEGDDVILSIAQEVKREKNSQNSKGRNERDPRVYIGTRPASLNNLPFPAWDLLEKDVDGHELLEDYIQTPVWGGSANNSSATSFTMERSLTTVSSRGCPHNCAFCYRGAQGERNYGRRDANDIIKEATWLRDRYKIDFLGFPDDNFAIDRKRLSVLAERFPKETGLRWGTHTRLDEADNRLEDMAKAGCIYIGFGAESASAKVLTLMKKGGFMLKRGLVTINGFSFPRTMVEGINHCLEIGIHSNCTWIMGYPGETLDDLKISVAFIKWQIEKVTKGLDFGTSKYDLAVSSINQKMFVATAYPGTEMFREPRVQSLLSRHFGLIFNQSGEPVYDDNLRKYIEELDDASKVLSSSDGTPINYSEMTDEQFLTAREYINQGTTEKILGM